MPHLGFYLCRLFSPLSIGSDCNRAWISISFSRSSQDLKYEGLCERYICQAIAIETSCVFGRDTNAFISRLGHLAALISGERCEAEFLRQRLSLATVRFVRIMSMPLLFFHRTSKDWNNLTFDPADAPSLDIFTRKLRNDNA